VATLKLVQSRRSHERGCRKGRGKKKKVEYRVRVRKAGFFFFFLFSSYSLVLLIAAISPPLWPAILSRSVLHPLTLPNRLSDTGTCTGKVASACLSSLSSLSSLSNLISLPFPQNCTCPVLSSFLTFLPLPYLSFSYLSIVEPRTKFREEQWITVACASLRRPFLKPPPPNPPFPLQRVPISFAF
jgi:hypothetical protein